MQANLVPRLLREDQDEAPQTALYEDTVRRSTECIKKIIQHWHTIILYVKADFQSRVS
jgi:hypothetical protein